MRAIQSAILKRSFSSRMARSRHHWLRITLVLFIAISFVALIWFDVCDNETATAGKNNIFFPHNWKNKNVNTNGTTPFSNSSNRSGASPVQEKQRGKGDIWFSPDTRAARAGNGSWLLSVFTSVGSTRVAIPSDVRGDAVTCEPRIFAFVAPWETYERLLATVSAHTCEAASIADVNEALQVSSQKILVPVKHVEVRLLQQRKSRYARVVPAEATLPIVGILPRESTVLVSAEDVLLKSDLDQEDLMSLVAAVQPASYDKTSRVVAIDTRSRAWAAQRHDRGANRSTSEESILIPSPLLELGSMPRRHTKSSIFSAAESSGTSDAATVLKWRTEDATALNSGSALEITLSIAHPGQPRLSYLLNAKDQVKSRPSAQDDTYTAALEAIVCSRRIFRLYGLSASVAFMNTYGGPANENSASGGLHEIPLNMSKEVEMMVGSTTRLSSGGVLLSGVVPLLYLELYKSKGAPAEGGAEAKGRQTVGVLWLHPGPFFVSTLTSSDPTEDDRPPRTCVRLRGTAGATGLYLLPGPTPAEVLLQYYTLTGFPTLPPRFLLGYHHGLQNDADTNEKSVGNLSETFLSSGVPLDSVWITGPAVATGDTPFTWNHTRFPDPLMLQSNLWHRGRRYVVVRSVPTIPITARSPLFVEGRQGGFFVSMTTEETVSWPALSVDGVPCHVVDFFNPAARKWYGGMLKYQRYIGSSNHTFLSLKHSTPSVQASPTTGQEGRDLVCSPPSSQVDAEPLLMDLGHHGGVPHRQVHQLLPLLFAHAAHEGMLRRTHYHKRALIFTESYFAGIQQYAVVQVETQAQCTDTVPTDPSATLREAWHTLQRVISECAHLGMLGIPFSGANLAGGLVSRSLLLAKMLGNATTPTASVAVSDGQYGGSNATGENDVLQNMMGEMEELLVRWYQVGVFFGAMYSDEPASTNVNAPKSPTAAPWWLRLPVTVATRQAIYANLHARYSLLPYLYTAAHHASEHGSIFLAPLTFVSMEASSSCWDATAPTCYATGNALVVCPVTQPLRSPQHPSRGNLSCHLRGEGFFDFWLGTWYSADSPTSGSASPWAAVEKNRRAASQELAWLAAGEAVSPKDLPAAASLAPVLLRSGHIVATQNVFTSRTASTHVGANWTITVALPPLPPIKGPATRSRLLLAEGDVYWDEGSHNSQSQPHTMKPGTSPPAGTPRIPASVNHCVLEIKCFYDDSELSAPTARLTVEVRQTSESCSNAMGELESHWNEVPRGFAERLRSANAQREARLHQLKNEGDALEDKGLRYKNNRARDSVRFSRPTPEDLQGLRLPDERNESVLNALYNTYLLQRFRFLFQRAGDAARLEKKSSAPTGTGFLVVESLSSSSDMPGAHAKETGETRETLHASFDAPNSHVIVVEMKSHQQNEVALASVFGARKVVLPDGLATVHVPPRHTWRFIFPLGAV